MRPCLKKHKAKLRTKMWGGKVWDLCPKVHMLHIHHGAAWDTPSTSWKYTCFTCTTGQHEFLPPPPKSLHASRIPQGSVSSSLHRGHNRHLQTLLPEKLSLTCVMVHCLLFQSRKYISDFMFFSRNLSFKRVSVNPVLEFVAHRLSSPDNQAS